MSEVRQGRWTAKIEGDFVVFVIGARFDVRNPVRSLGEYDAIYGNMAPRGLGKASELVPLSGDTTARRRLKNLAR